YCKAKGRPEKKFIDDKSIICIGFVDVFITQKGIMSKSSIELLKENLTEQERVELFAYITLTNCQQQFGSLMSLQPEDGQ
ncbi:carboxymuconolactone decarboxylase family protein, partial [Staphylococcus saccharolyticus]